MPEARVKAVIVAAGYGTRFLPVTRVVPKELLPIVDRPAIDFVVDELVAAGVTDLLVITSRRKKALDDWFDRDPELEAVFDAEGATAKRAKIVPPGVRTTFVRQDRMAGTGDALLLARAFAGDDPVLVAFPDDLFDGENPSAALLDVWRRTGASVLLAADLRGEDVSRYGVLDVDADQRLVRVVEKPAPGTAPSSLVSFGRFLYTPAFFDALAAARAAHVGDGEFFPMPAMAAEAAAGRVRVHTTTARRIDTGTPLGWLMANVDAALARPDVGPALAAWLRERVR